MAPKLPNPQITNDAAITSTTEVGVKWPAVHDASGYVIEINGGFGGAPNGADGLSHTFSGLTPDTENTVTIFATAIGNANFEDSDPVELKVRTLAKTKLGTPVPANDTTTTSYDRIGVRWPAVTNADGYSVRIDGAAWIVVPQGGVSHTFTALNSNTKYKIEVKATSTDIAFDDSDIASIDITTEIQATKLQKVTIADAPFTKPGTRQVEVSWTPSTIAGAEFAVNISPAATDGTTDFVTADAPHTFTKLLPDTDYTFTVITKANPADPSKLDSDPEVKTVRTKALPKLATPVPANDATGTTTDKIKVKWPAIANADAYSTRIAGQGWKSVPSGTSFLFDSLGADTSYVIEVKATSTNVDFLESDVGSVTIKTNALPDTVKPVITMIGQDEKISVGTAYTDKGATANDDRDGDITGNIVTTNPVDGQVPGVYIVKYNVQDTAGNKADEVTRTVTVQGTAMITIIGGDETIPYGSVYTDKGATGTDDLGNAVTVNTTSTIDTSKPGAQKVIYEIPAGVNVANTVTAERKVTVQPQTGKASFTLKGDNPKKIDEGTPYVEEGVQNVIKDDGTPGNIADVAITGTVDAAPGTYTLVYTYPKAASGGALDIVQQRGVIVKAKVVQKPSYDPTKWLEGDELKFKDVKGTEYDKAVDLARIVEAPDLHPENRVAAYYDEEAMDPYERRIVADLSKKDY